MNKLAAHSYFLLTRIVSVGLGLYLNPIGNGGATAIAQMLRRNHTLTTVDVHGCGNRGKGREVLEGYGCKVIKATDGTEYIARVVAPIAEEEEGTVTDQRLLDTIQTFVAFNRINPTREQAIRGIMSSNRQSQDAAPKKTNDSEQRSQSIFSAFISELGTKPPNDKLTEEEKRSWKDCEWKRLYVEMERARAAKMALANQLETSGNHDVKNDATNDEEEALVEGDKQVKENETTVRLQRKSWMHLATDSEEAHDMSSRSFKTRRDLDHEVVHTDGKSWRDLKMGITGSIEPSPRNRSALSGVEDLNSIHDGRNTTSPPPGAFFAGIEESPSDDAGDATDMNRSLDTVEDENEDVDADDDVLNEPNISFV